MAGNIHLQYFNGSIRPNKPQEAILKDMVSVEFIALLLISNSLFFVIKEYLIFAA